MATTIRFTLNTSQAPTGASAFSPGKSAVGGCRPGLRWKCGYSQPSVGLAPTEATTGQLPSSIQQKQPPSGLPRWEQRLSSYLLNQEIISHVTFKSRCNDSRQIHPFSFDSKLAVFSADPGI